MAARPKLSAFVVSYNRERLVGTTLRALAFADELILVDKNSTDRTREVAAPLVDRIAMAPWSAVVEDTRAYALSLCSHDWILFLDDDECLTPEAVRFIHDELRSPRADVYGLPQRHHIMGVHDERAFYWPEHQFRFIRRGALEFTLTTHGGLKVISDKVLYVPPDDGVAILHLSHASAAQFIEKTNRYTSRDDRVRSLDEGADLIGFAHRAIDKWSAGANSEGDDYVAAAGMLRAIYDLVDRTKTWEAERGLDGEAAFQAICERLDARYAQELADLAKPRVGLEGVPEPFHPANEPSGQSQEPPSAAWLRTNATLAEVLRDTRREGENLRRFVDTLRDEGRTASAALDISNAALLAARSELESSRAALAEADRRNLALESEANVSECRVGELVSEIARLQAENDTFSLQLEKLRGEIATFEQEASERRRSVVFGLFNTITRLKLRSRS